MSINKEYVDKELRDFVTDGYKSLEEWEQARDSNKEIVGAKMSINNKTESWICKKCGHIIVMNINGNRAKMKVGKNTQVYVKFSEMAAWCENCKEFNHISLSYMLDSEDNQDTSFIEDKARGEKKLAVVANENTPEIERYFLKLDN